MPPVQKLSARRIREMQVGEEVGTEGRVMNDERRKGNRVKSVAFV